MTIDHATLEREARKLCEQERGPGAWDSPCCHRDHWRKRVQAVADIAESGWMGKRLAQACGWFG